MEPCLFRHGKKINGQCCFTPDFASMEPCLFRHGKHPRPAPVLAGTPRASMEPCLFRHGKEEDSGYLVEPEVASMEPCLFRHGKGVTRGTRRGVTGLQWSHVFSDMVSLSRSGRLGSSGGGFNGAMSFQTW